MRNLLLMLVSCSDRRRGLFSSTEKEKSLIIYTATLDHSLNFSWVYLRSVHFHPDWVSSASVSIYKACGLTAGSSTDPAIDSQWCEGLEVEKQNKAYMAAAHVLSSRPWPSHWPSASFLMGKRVCLEVWSTKTSDYRRMNTGITATQANQHF